MGNRYQSNKKKAVRARNRSDFKVKRTMLTDIVCGVLAFVTTVLIWLFAG